jgi:hypothetical protein
MLSQAIHDGKLKIGIRGYQHGLFVFIGGHGVTDDYDACDRQTTRHALVNFAQTVNERPRFLFSD